MRLARRGERTLADVMGVTTEDTLSSIFRALGDLGYAFSECDDPDDPDAPKRVVLVSKDEEADEAEAEGGEG